METVQALDPQLLEILSNIFYALGLILGAIVGVNIGGFFKNVG